MCDGTLPVPPCFVAGETFTKANIKEVSPNLTPLLPMSFTWYCLVKLRLCIPINDGAVQVCTGLIVEGHRNAFESNAEGSSFWLDVCPDWSPALQAASVLNGPVMHHGSFPKLTKDQDWATYVVLS